MRPHHQLALLIGVLTSSISPAIADENANRRVADFLRAHCTKCHSAEDANAGLDFASLQVDLSDKEQAPLWISLIEQTQQGKMPPKEEPRTFNADQLQAITLLIESHLPRSSDHASKTTSGLQGLLQSWRDHHRNIVLGLLAFAWLGIQTVQRNREGKSSPLMALLLLTAVGAYEAEAWSLRQSAFSEELADNIHYATFHDFGFPPLPDRPPVADKQLHGVYYRGNDERSEKLFNNGNYRTSTLRIELCDATGDPVGYDRQVADMPLHVRFEIQRAPNSPDYFFMPKVMDTMFLTRQCERFLGRYESVTDRVNLEILEPMQRWQACFPVGAISEGANKTGVIYVCEERTYTDGLLNQRNVMGGARMHYAIEYNLTVNDDKLSPESEVFMGALYRTRKLDRRTVPMSQWFSHEPIPVLPGKNVKDIELLGIDDRLKR